MMTLFATYDLDDYFPPRSLNKKDKQDGYIKKSESNDGPFTGFRYH